jgi:hypothetical protein
MDDYVDRLLEEVPDEMSGTAVTPAGAHLFQVNDKADILDDKTSDLYHHLVAKLLYLCKRARPDIMTATAFLTTKVSKPDTDDYKKLTRCIKYLREYPRMPLTLSASKDGVIKWWVDASFAVHQNMRSHTGAVMMLGQGGLYNMSTKQKINTTSSTEAELVGVNDAMPMVIWVRNFLIAQGFNVTDNTLYQDNQSAMLLERNGKSSSGRRTRHIEIRYFFVTDRIKNGELRVEYCPTGDMIADFFTKPLQGSLFRKMRAYIMGMEPDLSNEAPVGSRSVLKNGVKADDAQTGHSGNVDVAMPIGDPSGAPVATG